MAFVTLIAVGLGGWIAYSNYRIARLTELRQQGAIVIIRDRTPTAFQSVGLKPLAPFYSVPTVELYVTPRGTDAMIGNRDELIPKAVAQESLLEIAAIARSFGAEDIQLILLDNLDSEWMEFARDHSMSIIGENRDRYLARLKANQDSGANINP